MHDEITEQQLCLVFLLHLIAQAKERTNHYENEASRYRREQSRLHVAMIRTLKGRRKP